MDQGTPTSSVEGSTTQPLVTTSSPGTSQNSLVSSGLSQEDISRIVAAVAGYMQPRLTMTPVTSTQQHNPLSAGGSTVANLTPAMTVTTSSGKE